MGRKKKDDLPKDLPTGLSEHREKVGGYIYNTIRSKVIVNDEITLQIRQRFSYDENDNTLSRQQAIDFVLCQREKLLKEYKKSVKLPENFSDEVYIDENGRKRTRIVAKIFDKDGNQKVFFADYGRLYRRVRSKKEAIEMVYGKLKLFEKQEEKNE
jgi:hypothetical protein